MLTGFGKFGILFMTLVWLTGCNYTDLFERAPDPGSPAGESEDLFGAETEADENAPSEDSLPTPLDPFSEDGGILLRGQFGGGTDNGERDRLEEITLNRPLSDPDNIFPTQQTNDSDPSPDEPGDDGEISNEPDPFPFDSRHFCGSAGSVVLNAGQSTTLQWQSSSEPNAIAPNLSLSPPLGSLQGGGINSSQYTAPASVPEAQEVQVLHTFGEDEFVVCRIQLIANEDLAIEDDGLTEGVVGNVYSLPANTRRLPDFSLLVPIQTVLVPNFDIAPRRFDQGFPGVRDLFEWFGIHFEGIIDIPESGSYRFRVHSDDGAILYIDNEIAVNNDGVHAPRSREASLHLEAGQHRFDLDYFQGPRYQIALQVFWRRPGQNSFEVVPPGAFGRPD